MTELLRTKRNTILIGAGVTAAILLYAVLREIPLSEWIRGLFPAIGSGLTAAALVLMYRTARIINFAQLALGAIAAQLFYETYTRGFLPYPLALLGGLIVGVLVAVIIGLIASLLFFRHPRLVMTVVTIVFVGLIGFISGSLNQAFTPEDEVTRPIQTIYGPFQDATVEISGIPFRFAHLVGMLALLGVSIGLVMFFRKTRMGVAIRAAAENADRASLLGINVKALHVGVWALAGGMASVAMLGSIGSGAQPFQQNIGTDQTALLLPLTAAVFARMTSMPVAYFTALALEVLTQFIIYDLPATATVFLRLGIVAFLIVSLLVQRRKLAPRAEEASSWKAVKEIRPTPRELLQVAGVRRSRYVFFALLTAFVLGLPWIVGVGTLNAWTTLWPIAIIGLSLVILTGWTGQISLGQYAFVAVGAFVGGIITREWASSFAFWFALPISGLAGAAFALLIGIPALRIRGLFLAATTFGVAILVPLFIFDQQLLGDIAPKDGLSRPELLFLNFEEPRSFYYLCLLMFAAIMAGIHALRKSRGGRVLIALRDNEDGVQSFGVDIVRTRLTAFAISGFIAAVAGCLTVHQGLGMGDQAGQYGLQQSIFIFILVVIGGVGVPLGAVLGALYFIVGGLYFSGAQALLTGVLGLVVLMFIPGGLVQVVFGARDAVLRVVAMRRHIVVPSLFADYSPEAWERRLAPLAPAVQSQGLGVLRAQQRYRLPSKIFGRATV